MPRADQPVTHEDVDAIPDDYPDITAETKPEDFGRLSSRVLALDYGLPDKEIVQERRKYYHERAIHQQQ